MGKVEFNNLIVIPSQFFVSSEYHGFPRGFEMWAGGNCYWEGYHQKGLTLNRIHRITNINTTNY